MTGPPRYFDLVRQMKNPYSYRLSHVDYARTHGIKAGARIFQTTVPTVRKWLRRYQAQGPKGLQALSRAPHRSNSTALQQLLWLLALTILGSLVVLRRRRGLGLSLALTMLLVLLWTACGGGGNSRLPSGTPAGTYALTVTATTSGGPSHLVKVTLIVN
jgi:hypothetical protein